MPLLAASDLQRKPTNLTFEEAAAVPVTALTAWQTVIEAANVQPGQHILIQGAAGGVGHFAVQFARWKGAYVIGTASAVNADFIRSLGVDQSIDYQTTRFESVGSRSGCGDRHGRRRRFCPLVECYPPRRDPGHGWSPTHSGYGNARRDQRYQRRSGTHREICPDNLAPRFQGRLRPFIGAVFPLEEAGKAQTLSQGGHLRGKIVLQVSNLSH